MTTDARYPSETDHQYMTRTGQQMPTGELAGIIRSSQPWKDEDDIRRDAMAEALRQRLWNGHGR